jgi:hypothetical protein
VMRGEFGWGARGFEPPTEDPLRMRFAPTVPLLAAGASTWTFHAFFFPLPLRLPSCWCFFFWFTEI